MIKANPLRDHVAAVSCGVFQNTAVLDLDYAEDSEAETDANFIMTGAGNHRGGAGHRREDAVQRGAIAGAAGARATRHRQARRSAEDGGDVSTCRIADHGPARDRDPQSGQARRDARSAFGLRRRGRFGRRVEACRSRRKPARRSRPTPASRRWPPPRHPNMPAFADDSGLAVDALDGEPGIHSARWAGPDKDFRRAMNEVQTRLIERGAKAPERRRAHFVSALCVAWPDGHVEEFEARVNGRWSGRRAAPRASATIRCSCRTGTPAPSAKCQPRKSTACRRRDRACRIARAPSSSLRRRALASGDDARPSASTCTGRSACRSARTATSTATSAMPRSTRRASCARSKPRSPRLPRACPAAR